MKNLSISQKIIWFFNYLFALLLLLAFAVPYLPGNIVPVLSLASLIFPFLLVINILFVLYWITRLKKQFFLSLLVLILNYNNIQALYQWEGKYSDEKKGFSIMSYNVRLFNAYRWIEKKGIDVDISNYLKDQNPDILLLQEYQPEAQTDFSQYKNKHIVLKGTKRKAGLAIYSNFEIVHQGNLNFSNTYNNAIWADIVLHKDTIRVYNVHLQSYKIIKPENLVEQKRSEVKEKLQKVFKRQREQSEKIQKHIENSPYPVMIGGDFNNTAFSAPYNILKTNKTDAFVEAGEGFGITWQYKWIPLRIDFILTDQNKFEVLSFETLNYIKYSDHYPIKAQIRLTSM